MDMLERAARALANIDAFRRYGADGEATYNGGIYRTDARGALQAALDPEDEALVEIVARAIYAVELARDDNCNSLLIKIGGNPHPSTRIETFEENPESWREYAVAAIRSMRFSPRVREPNCSAQVTASEVSDRE